MIVNRKSPGLYEARSGRGSNTRRFEIKQVGRDDPDGLPPGWAVHEVGISYLTIQGDGWSMIAAGLSNKKAAVAAAEAEL